MIASIVYVIGGEKGPQKVGISRDPSARLKSLQTQCAHPIQIMHLTQQPREDARIVERVAHAILWGSRTFGEWFNVSVDEAIGAVEKAEALVLAGDISILTTIPKPVTKRGCFRKKEASDPPERKSVAMSSDAWRDIAKFQTQERIATEAEALRRVVMAGLRAMGIGSKK